MLRTWLATARTLVSGTGRSADIFGARLPMGIDVRLVVEQDPDLRNCVEGEVKPVQEVAVSFEKTPDWLSSHRISICRWNANRSRKPSFGVTSLENLYASTGIGNHTGIRHDKKCPAIAGTTPRSEVTLPLHDRCHSRSSIMATRRGPVNQCSILCAVPCEI